MCLHACPHPQPPLPPEEPGQNYQHLWHSTKIHRFNSKKSLLIQSSSYLHMQLQLMINIQLASITNIWDKTSRPHTIYSHLIWVCIAIGLHSFSLYCHNDTLEALGRPEDIFHDNSIQLKAIFAKQSFLRAELQPDIEMLDKKIIRITQELGTADFIVHHIHAFHLV